MTGDPDRRAFLLKLSEAWQAPSTALPRAEDIMQRAAELLGQHLGASRVGYAEVVNTGEELDVRIEWTDGTHPSYIGRRPATAHDGEDVRAFSAGETWIVTDAETDPRASVRRVASAYIEAGARATIAIPLVREGRCNAMLYACCDRARVWSPSEIDLAWAVAERTWLAVERARSTALLRDG